MNRLILLLISFYPLAILAQKTTSISGIPATQTTAPHSTSIQLQEVISQIKTKVEEINNLGDQIKGLRLQLKALMDQRDLLQKKIDDLEKIYDRTDAQEKQLAKLKNDLERLDRIMNALQKSIDDRSAKIDAARKEVEELQKRQAELERILNLYRDAAAHYALVKKTIQKDPSLKAELSASELKMYDFYENRYKTDASFRKLTDAELANQQAANANISYEEAKAKMKVTLKLIQEDYNREQQAASKIMN